MGYKVAVVGATGNIGREILNILAEREFPADTVHAVASEGSIGREVSYGEDHVLKVRKLDDFDFTGIDLALFAVNAPVAAKHAPRAAKAGCVVIDTSEQFRMEPGVPLVVPEVNPDALATYERKRIIASPSAPTTQALLALKPLYDAFLVRRVVLTTYHAVSGAGRDAMDELFTQTRNIYVNEPPSKTQEVFPKQIAFNVIPQVDSFMDDGATREEWHIQAETRKILGPDLGVHANCCRVPVFVGHAAYINVECDEPIDDKAARRVLREAPGLIVIDHRVEEGYVTPVEAAGEDSVYVSRLRTDTSVEHGVSFWCVGDNGRKGTALNAVQIAEILVRDYL